MTRPIDLWDQMTSFPTLREAAWRASRGKRDRLRVARFLERCEPEILALQRELRSGAYMPSAPYEFTIRDPKERRISAAPFRDRVVHHAVMDVLAPRFERRMIFESFACRIGKGTHAALDHAQRQVRRFPWFLKLDIHHCFETLHHDVVLTTVAKVVRHPRVLGLLERMVRHHGSDHRGLPIGALTSQWLANLVLDRLDHHVKEVLRVPGYVRYMDDFVLFAHEKPLLSDWLGKIRTSLKLTLSETHRMLRGVVINFRTRVLRRGIRRWVVDFTDRLREVSLSSAPPR